MSRQDLWRVSLTVDGVDLGFWDSKSGGNRESAETKWRDGGTGKEESLGGPASTTNVSLARRFKQGRDDPRVKWLVGRAGRGRCVCVQQPLDKDRNPFGDPWTYTGTLLNVNLPETDSNSTDASTIGLEISADEDIT